MARVTDTGGRPVSGQVPVIVIAIVVDNVDPEGLGRIKVKYPTLPGEPKSFWIRQISSNGGAVGGIYALPEKDDEVLVAFIQGHQDYGVILGQFWNGTTKPPKEAADGMPGSGKTDTGGQLSKDSFTDGSSDIKKNDRRFWRSRAGHLIVMDDTQGKETIQIWDGTHTMCVALDSKNSRLVISNTKGDVHIRTKQDFVVEAGRDIKIRAGQHILGESAQKTDHKAGTSIHTESGTDTTMEAKANFSIDAGQNVTIKGKLDVKIQGNMFSAKGNVSAEMQGGASATVKAGVVKIN